MTDTHQRNTTSGPLRRVLDDACAQGASMETATVLAPANDPYRQDTPTGHKEGKWFAKHFNAAIETRGRPTLHLRGVHYALVAAGRIKKPNGKPYTNTDRDWQWLQNGPAKCARWLGYIPFEVIVDNRAAEPTIREVVGGTPDTWIQAGIKIPEIDEVEIEAIGLAHGRQPYRLVIFGEKSSLADVVTPIAEGYDADLFLETGEISDSHLHLIAAAAAKDGRPLRVFTLSDCDPSGYQMPVSIGRKLQALRSLLFPDLDFEVIPVALMPDQVRTLELPSTPLKDGEKRGPEWRAAWGIEQTEIDALATLRPDTLAELLDAALRPFYDHTLDRRVALAVAEWRQEAQAAIDAHVDPGALDAIRDDVARARTVLEASNDQLQALTAEIELPGLEMPEPTAIDPTSNGHQPLVASAWSWTEQTRRLKARKAYEPDESTEWQAIQNDTEAGS